MEVTNLSESIERLKQHGDAVKIAKLVNELRRKSGEKILSPATVRSVNNNSKVPHQNT